MLENTLRLLKSGDLDAARASLAREVGELFRQSFVAGRAEHPILGPDGGRLIEALRTAGPSLSGDQSRSRYVEEVLHEVGSRVVLREDVPGTVFLFNHALHLIEPEYPLRVQDALEAARADLGDRLQGDETAALAAPFFPAQTAVLILATGKFFGGVDEPRLNSIQRLSLADLDAPEGTLPGFPSIRAIEGRDFVFECPSCGAARRAPVASAGDEHGCDCGAWTRVPIPGLVRLAAWLKELRDRARGLSRCRVCGSVIQTGRSGIMHAGFCSPVCAKEARVRFREFVAPPGRPEGDAIRYSCACGASLTAPRAAVGSRLPCGACGLEVWVPEAPLESRKGPSAPCPKCGRAVKAAAVKCMYCGTSRA